MIYELETIPEVQNVDEHDCQDGEDFQMINEQTLRADAASFLK